MTRIASNGEKAYCKHVHVNPCFLISHWISPLSYTGSGVRIKLQNPEQIHVPTQYGHLFTGGPALLCSLYKLLIMNVLKHVIYLYDYI